MHLDLRHLGSATLHERLPLICELAEQYVGVDPAKQPIPVAPTAHYTMGGIRTDRTTATTLPGLFAVGEVASSGLHGANRLGSNSLAELLVLGSVAGRQAADLAWADPRGSSLAVRQTGADVVDALVLPALVVVFGFLLPFGVLGEPDVVYARLVGFMTHPLGSLAVLALLALLLWHGSHRGFHALHDLQIEPPEIVRVRNRFMPLENRGL